MKKTLFLLFSLLIFSGPAFAQAPENAKFIPIQHNGRVKPLDAFARQTLRLISARETWQKKPALDILFDGLTHPQTLADLAWVRIDYLELKTALGLAQDRHFFSLNEINPSLPKIQALVKTSKTKRGQDIRPSKLEQKAEQLLTQVRTVENLISGESLRLIPEENAEWSSPYLHKNLTDNDFPKTLQESREKSASAAQHLHFKLVLEVWYYHFRPFECAAVFYLLGFLALAVPSRKTVMARFGIFSIFAALALHTIGIAARVYILSRPPVSNMYESMIFMNWALMIYACVFSLIRKNALAITTGAILSALIMVYANLLPIDSSLEVLVPVLRSNYWLTIHVMTIVSSYGAFGLAMALGHRHLFLQSIGKLNKSSEAESSTLIFRVIQLGALLIGTGTFLGGVWANESWGRFWGWDPKETWALITFLGYLIIVHLKYAKKISHFYLALSSVLGFLLVLMTWYGVNFVLGRGLHSYGAGSGGMQWVIYYLVFETLFVGYIFFKKFRTSS